MKELQELTNKLNNYLEDKESKLNSLFTMKANEIKLKIDDIDKNG